jgi:hypothetical protein
MLKSKLFCKRKSIIMSLHPAWAKKEIPKNLMARKKKTTKNNNPPALLKRISR